MKHSVDNLNSHNPVISQKVKCIRELQLAVRKLWTSCTLSEISCENYKIIVVSSHVPMYVVIQALVKLNKSFVAVFSEELDRFVGCFGSQQLIAYLIHAWFYCSDLLYRQRFLSILSLFCLCSSTYVTALNSVSSEADDELSQDNQGDPPQSIKKDKHLGYFFSHPLKKGVSSPQQDILKNLQENYMASWSLPEWFSVSLLSDLKFSSKTFSCFINLLQRSKRSEDDQTLQQKQAHCKPKDMSAHEFFDHHNTGGTTEKTPIQWPSPLMYTMDIWRCKSLVFPQCRLAEPQMNSNKVLEELMDALPF